jgi:hypothetical protein
MSALKLFFNLLHPLGIVKQFTLWGGGGGGGGGSSPAQTQTQVKDLPTWAQPYAQNTLSKASALTENAQMPQYTGTVTNPVTGQNFAPGQMIAGFSPLQQTAMNTVSSPQAFGQSVQGYMSPYMDDVIKQQQLGAIQQGGINAATLQAKGASAGAFGGSGLALQSAQQQRDLAQQLNSIQASGLQNAYQQGVQQANTAVGQQQQLGQQQQQLGQQAINANYQNFLNQQNYPYQQLSYMSNLIQGTPMGMNAQSQVFQGAPTTAQSLSALGMGAYGLSQLAAKGGLMKAKKFKKGGKVKHFDEGGLSIIQKFNNPNAMMSDMSAMSDQELQKIISAPTTPAEAQAAAQELAMRQQSEQAIQASESRGLANAYNQLPAETQNQMASYAGGGILAFAKGGNALDKYMDEISGPEATYTAPTAEERQTGIAGQQQFVGGLYGKSNLDPYIDQIKQQRADIASGKDMQEMKGLAALQAASAMLQGTNFARGLGNAAGVFAQHTVQAKKDMRAADQALQQSEINLASAQQARADGQTGKAVDLFNQSEAGKQKAAELAQGAAEKKATIQAGVDNSIRQTNATIAALSKPTDMDKQANAIYNAAVTADPTIVNDPKRNAQAIADARATASQQLKPGFTSAENAQQKAANTQLDNQLALNREYQKALQKGDFATAGQIRSQAAQALGVSAQSPQPGQQSPQTITVGGQVINRPANFTDQQWNAYKQAVGAQ